jgi:hypothetical protein
MLRPYFTYSRTHAEAGLTGCPPLFLSPSYLLSIYLYEYIRILGEYVWGIDWGIGDRLTNEQ